MSAAEDSEWGRSGADECIVKGVWRMVAVGVFVWSRSRLLGTVGWFAAWFATSGNNLCQVRM